MNIREHFHNIEYTLPLELIAQYPLQARDESRLLVMQREKDTFLHTQFTHLIDFLKKGDVLVLNDTRVIPARILGHKVSGGKVEILFLRMQSKDTFQALVKPSGRIAPGTNIFLKEGSSIHVKILGACGKARLVQLPPGIDCETFLKQYGSIPLPPYVKRPSERSDEETYQTIFAHQPGAVAAPTAGLHFTKGLLERINAKGVQTVYITLHVGYGTFMPIRVEDIRTHRMHEEEYHISSHAAAIINKAKAEGRRIIAVGTTTVRALESSTSDGVLIPTQGFAQTCIFIYPPYSFAMVDGLITNFHLPGTTLLLLVAAFCGREKLLAAYEEAISERYRFYSYGDAMLIF